MSYVKQEFTDGQVLKAEHLNHIEEGIYTAEENQQKTIDDLSGTIPLIIYSETEPEGVQGMIWLKPVEDSVVES